MPKLKEYDNYICFYCGSKANWVSVNSKLFRCVEKITQCSGFIIKAESSRKINTTEEERIAHMKRMSVSGNKKLQQLHTDPAWVDKKGKKISDSLQGRGGHRGERNPMFNKKHKSHAKQLQSFKASSRSPESYQLATSTKIERGIAVPKESKTEWELYREKVTNFTNISWKYAEHIINPNNLNRGNEYELDHKFSITEGFIQGVPPEIIGHPSNLELLPKRENRSKRIKCSITREELYEAVKVSSAPFSPSSLTDI